MEGAELDLSMLRAAANSNAATNANLIAKYGNVAARDDDGWTPLHVAALRNTDPAVAALLLDRGADVAAKADSGVTPLHFAGFRNTEPAVTALLLDRGANIEAKTNHGLTPLHMAAGHNPEPAVVALLIKRDADTTALDEDGETPYDFAASREELNDEILRLLRGDVTAADWLGLALRKAAAMGDALGVARLLALGADIDARDNNGGTPLHWAAVWNASPAVATLLLDHGASIEARDDAGWTPLHVVVERNAELAVAAPAASRRGERGPAPCPPACQGGWRPH